MSLAGDIAKIVEQEKLLRFRSFDEAAAWQLGQSMRELAVKKLLPLVIDVRVGTRPLFYTALPGTTVDNPDWARRKANTVLRFFASSYRVGLEHKQSGKGFDLSRGLDPMNYAPAGGGFPLHIEGTGVVGAICVSGVPQRQDHEFVVEALCSYLKQSYTALALGPESA